MATTPLKPTIPVVNWKNGLSRGLVWIAAPGKDTTYELISKKPGTLLASGAWNGLSAVGKALSSTSSSNGGAFWPFTVSLQAIKNTFSIIVWAKPDGLTAFSHLLTIPYSATWVSPFYAIQFLRDNATSNLSVAWTVGGSAGTAQGTTNGAIVQGNPLTMYATTVQSNGNARFFKNGKFLEQATRASSGGNVDFGNKREVTLLNHNSGDVGEGIQGVCPFAAIWNRQLLDKEVMSLYTNPWQIINFPDKNF